MWYFTWILGVLLACSFGIINALWLEATQDLDKEPSVDDCPPPLAAQRLVTQPVFAAGQPAGLAAADSPRRHAGCQRPLQPQLADAGDAWGGRRLRPWRGVYPPRLVLARSVWPVAGLAFAVPGLWLIAAGAAALPRLAMCLNARTRVCSRFIRGRAGAGFCARQGARSVIWLFQISDEIGRA